MVDSSTIFAAIIFAFTIGVSLYALFRDNRLLDKYLMHPYSVVRYNQWITVVSSGFIHADIMHLMFNMLTFYFFAFHLERTIGSMNFGLIYFGSMIISHLPSLIKHKDDYNYRSLGASGAISGILFSTIMFYPDMTLGMMILPVRMPAIIFGVLYLVWCWYAAKNANDNIGHDAHLYGALAGIVLTIILIPGVIDNFLFRMNYVF